jgi:ElaB/YqjD/DUF883 family membrane-anchored ribosome-binding protein
MATYENPFPTSGEMPPSGSRSGLPDDDIGALPDAMRSGASSGTGYASTGGGSLLNKVVQGAHDAIDRLAEKATPALDGMNTHADQFKAMEEEWVQTARSTVRDHPLAAVGAAVVFGMLVARLTR